MIFKYMQFCNTGTYQNSKTGSRSLGLAWPDANFQNFSSRPEQKIFENSVGLGQIKFQYVPFLCNVLKFKN